MQLFQVLAGFFLFLIGLDFISSWTKFISSHTWASPRARGASVRPFGRSSVRLFVRSGRDGARNLRRFQLLKAGDPKFATVSGFGRMFFYFLLVRILFLPGRNLFPRAPGPAPGLGGRPFVRSTVRPFVCSSVRVVTGHEICDSFTF